MIIKSIKTRVFKEGKILLPFITRYIKNLPERSVVVVTSKIVSLSERRTAVIENVNTKLKLMRKESELVIPTRYAWLTVKDGMAMSSAGIDESNANGKLILLPKNSFKTAHFLRKELQKKYGVKELGVIVTDSRSTPLRAAAMGAAIGYAGFRGLKDYRGKLDIFGRKFKFSRVNVADSLAIAAVLVMGEGNEQQPLAVIQKASIEFCDKVHPRELRINAADDMYRPLFSRLPKSI